MALVARRGQESGRGPARSPSQGLGGLGLGPVPPGGLPAGPGAEGAANVGRTLGEIGAAAPIADQLPIEASARSSDTAAPTGTRYHNARQAPTHTIPNGVEMLRD